MKNVLEYLEHSAEKYPDKIGFSDEEESVTFYQMMENAKRIASSLKGAGRNRPVAIMMDRNVRCIEAMMAIAYAGCFYTVVDIHSPDDRISNVLERLDLQVVMTDKENAAKAMRLSGSSMIVYEDAVLNEIDESFIENVRARMIDTDPLYVLFTSGSSGMPKGAVLSHRSVISYIEWVCSEFGFSENTSFGAQTPLYFSMSVTDLYSTMKCGGTYNIIPKSLFSFPVNLVGFLNERKVNTIYWVPSALSIICNWDTFEYVKPNNLEKIMFAGEPMPVKQLNYWRRHLPDCEYANLFGPTETTDICTFYRVEREFEDDGSLPIGRACDNCDVIVITGDGKEAVPGEEGELAVRGSFLADGYYNDPDKTAKAFVQNPLNSAYPERVYMTGDMVKINELGELIYIARKDFQVKRMGYRIELGEIESAAYAAKGVKSAVAVYDKEKDVLTVAYEGSKSASDDIRKALKSKVPSYMMPDNIARVKNMPRNANGKIDRRALMEII